MTIDPTFTLGAMLSRAVVTSFDELARDADIPPLDWQFMRFDEALVIEGRPRAAAEIVHCSRWADLLTLTEFAFEATSGHRAWYSNDGVWSIEVIALVPEPRRAAAPARRLVLSEADSL